MALLREVVADLDTSFVPHDASRCAIFLTITPRVQCHVIS